MDQAGTPRGGERGPSSRRAFLARAGRLGAASALAGVSLPAVHAGEDTTIRLALIGCGGRGTGAAADAFQARGGPVKLYAMADLFAERLASSAKTLERSHSAFLDVPPERRFVGYEAYKKAIDCLRPGDVAMLCGYAAWRPVQLEYAVERGVNVFMEKSFATDPPGIRRIVRAGEAAERKNLKIAAGLMCRHSAARQELIQKIRDGDLGEILLVRSYRMEPVGPLGPKPAGTDELSWQVRNFFRFFWVSGGLWAEMDIHQIDEISWVKDSWPVSAHGVSGRAADSADTSQNLDSYAVEWTFADGTKGTHVVRYLPNCHNQFDTYIHGTRRAAQFSGNIHASTVHTYRGQRISPEDIDWRAGKESCTLWQAEWNVLLEAIRNDRPHNEAKRAAYANAATIMGRAAAHMGRVVTWDEVMASTFEWFPGVDRIDERSEPPLRPDERGRYPAPVPGKWNEL
ncbi:MAG: Gfo/Idh/MocA family protein [Planctomycetota bacterium]